ncbi:hypothetical protein ACJJIW_08320 [Microbulbifer sp. JMSA004]|uniref:hypothetical protein n=1 Tax=unclassified Microbulbifer TaxID=2619833 RepID=UPI002B290EDC|nr:hypothetical protein QT397_16920 [Microbulbifer sp. MKSA007]WNZ58162.1 hypothetical protein QT397_12755 [Microbulbifer sp. MKSA007]WNZ58226.1 hypothetical protein QT397_13090 [Microbulbifer sp. MKSA007]
MYELFNISNIEALGILLWFCVVLALSYMLAIKKTLKVKRAVVVGGFMALLPPLAIIYLVSLLLRKSLSVSERLDETL